MKRVFYFCITLTLTLCIVLASCPFKASATSIALPFDIPYIFPSDSSWSVDDVVKEYGDLSEEQKRALHYIVGSNATMYGVNRGLSVEGVSDAVAWLGNLGERINTYIMSVPYQALNANSPLRRNLSNLIDYVSTSVSSTFESWYDSIVRLGHFGTVYNSDYAQGWTDLIGSSDVSAVDNWQNRVVPFSFTPSFVNVDWADFPQSLLYTLSSYSYSYRLGSNGIYLLYTNVPVNVDAVVINFASESCSFYFNGSSVDTSVNLGDCYLVTLTSSGDLASYRSYSSPRYIDFRKSLSAGTLRDMAVDALTSRIWFNSNSSQSFNFSSSQVQVRVGTSLVDSLPLEFDDSLGIVIPSLSRTVIYNPSVPVAIDALDVEKVVTGDFVADSARDYVESVALSLDDAQATTWNKEAVAVTIINPLADGSGINIPSNFFNGFTSYIDYLWSFAEPLVLYTRDLLTCLTFDGQGIAWIFFGVCSLGVIGGVVYKFLQ